MRRILLISLATILTGVLTSLEAQNPSTDATPTKSSSTPNSLSPTEIINKMLQLTASKGKDKSIAATYANAVGLSAAGQEWLARQVAIHGAPSDAIHGFCFSRGSDTDVLFFVRDDSKGKVLFFHAQRDGKVVMASIYNIKTGETTIQELNEAQKGVNGEMAFWANGIDKLLSDK